MFELKLLMTEEEYKKVEIKLGLKTLPHNVMYLRAGFFRKTLFKLKDILSKDNFSKFISVLKIENVEIKYSKVL